MHNLRMYTDMMLPQDYERCIEADGFAVIPEVLPETEIAALVAAVEALAATMDLGVRGGVRDLFELVPDVQLLAQDPRLRALVEPILGSGASAVRGILFDKTPGANWKVSWHQDVTIAVAERVDAEGYGPWSEKAGLVHVQPPVEVLNRMLTLRVHLDECHAANGPVRVLPGSHRDGRLSGAQIDAWRSAGSEVACVGGRGSVLVMRPLLLHASSPATSPGHRRVIHLEYAAGTLAAGLQWHERWGPASIAARTV